MLFYHPYRLTVLLLLICAPFFSFAQDEADTVRTEHTDSLTKNRFNLHFQTTYIYQYKPELSAGYSGPHSIQTAEEKQNSVTATLYVGARLWKGGELYINPEIAGGSGLSGAYGMAASTNGETFRVGDPAPTLYLARGFIKQTIPLNRRPDTMVDAQNQLNAIYTTRSLVFQLGKYGLSDIFDNNVNATGPRTSFLNWCLMSNGAWDYAANLRGYTYAFTTILKWDNMTYKAALAAMPTVANGPDLNTNLQQEYSINAQAERIYQLKGKTGNIRLLGYYNNGDMGNYATAIAQSQQSGTTPDVIATRKYGRDKYGAGLNIDQQINSTLGFFARVGWNDGKNETWCFTEADRTVSAGLCDNGAAWNRKDDNAGIAVVVNGLSGDHRQYLADGGLGFQLGDGRLSYANETVAEAYYSYKPLPASNLWMSADYQFGLNPGYNSDRGPVSVFSFRLHVEL